MSNVDETPTGDAVETPVDAPVEARTFTQGELDRIVQDRLARDRRDRPSDDEISQLREKATQYDELQQQGLSELERERSAREAAESSAKAAIERANARLIAAEVLTEATGANVIRPEHMHRLVDLTGVTVADDGTVTGVKDAVKAFLEQNPEYVGKAPAAGPVDQGARGAGNGVKQVTQAELAHMSTAEIAAAEKEGRLLDLMTGKT